MLGWFLPMNMVRRLALLLSATAIIAAVLSSCNDCVNCPSGPECSSGVVEGQVLGGGLPVAATVRAHPLFANDNLAGFFETSTDSTGWYHLELPDGEYLLRLRGDAQRCYYSHREPVARSSEADTLRLAAGSVPLRADFRLGALRVRVELPSLREGAFVALKVARRDTSQSSGWQTSAGRDNARIEEGVIQFSLSGLMSGVYAMRLHFGSDHPGLWLPNDLNIDDADTVGVETDRITDYDAVVGTENAHISGVIRGSWQAMGLSSPHVVLYEDSRTQLAAIETDAYGVFAANLLIAADVRIRVFMGNFGRWIGGESFEQAEVFKLRLGQEVTDILLEEGGLLIDSSSESRVDLWDLGGEIVHAENLSPVESHASMYFHGDSRFHPIPNLPPGDYLFRLYPSYPLASPYLDQWHDRAASEEEALVISIAEAGEVVPLTLRPLRGATIRGRITWTPQPRSYPVIFATTATSPEPLGKRGPDSWPESPGEACDFSLHGLADGDYKVGAWLYTHSGWEPPPDSVAWHPGTADWDSAAVIEIRNCQDVEGIAIELP